MTSDDTQLVHTMMLLSSLGYRAAPWGARIVLSISGARSDIWFGSDGIATITTELKPGTGSRFDPQAVGRANMRDDIGHLAIVRDGLRMEADFRLSPCETGARERLERHLAHWAHQLDALRSLAPQLCVGEVSSP